MQWKRVHLWHMLVHAIAGVLVLVTTARVLEVQMEKQVASNTQTSTTQVKSKGSLLLLA